MAEKIKQILLPAYTISEEKFNSISHEVGIYFSIVGFCALMLRCVFTSASKKEAAAALIFSASTLLLFTSSALYHWLGKGDRKRLLRLIDHCSVYFVVGGVFTPFYMLNIYDAMPEKSLLLLQIMWGTILLLTVLCVLDMDALKGVLYFINIALGTFMMYQTVINSAFLTKQIVNFIILGGFFISFGAIMYFVGGKHRWFHGVFHILALMSCSMFYLSIYFMI